MSFVLVPIVSSAWGSAYRFDEVIHSRSVTERLKQTEAGSPEGQRVLFGEVIIENNSAEVAWVAVGPSIMVLGINSQVGIEGPGAVGPVFGGTARSAALRLIEFGAQGLVVSDGGNINGRVGWHCPCVTPGHRVCQSTPAKSSASLQELDRVLAFADRGKAYEEFEGFEFRGRFIDREHILPTQINKLGQVVFIDPLGQVPNAVYLATPLLFGKKEGLSMLDGAMPEICLAFVCLVSAIVLTSSCGGPTRPRLCGPLRNRAGGSSEGPGGSGIL